MFPCYMAASKNHPTTGLWPSESSASEASPANVTPGVAREVSGSGAALPAAVALEAAVAPGPQRRRAVQQEPHRRIIRRGRVRGPTFQTPRRPPGGPLAATGPLRVHTSIQSAELPSPKLCCCEASRWEAFAYENDAAWNPRKGNPTTRDTGHRRGVLEAAM